MDFQMKWLKNEIQFLGSITYFKTRVEVEKIVEWNFQNSKPDWLKSQLYLIRLLTNKMLNSLKSLVNFNLDDDSNFILVEEGMK